ncbi:hypothetical protein HUJ04_007583 [Dendroctonus ponderosae]
MDILKIVSIVALILGALCEINSSQTLTPKNRGSKKKPDQKPKKKLTKAMKGPQKSTVFDKGLVVEDAKAKDILANYQAFFTETDDFNFNGMVLGYVTPWNNHGYDVAKIFGNKFTHISPVWLQIRRTGPRKYEVTGTHDIDKQWVIDVKNAGRERKTKVVPRVLFDGWTAADYQALFSDPEEAATLTETLVQSCQKNKFDGFVLEVWSQIAGAVNSEILVELIRSIGIGFAQNKLDFILVIPPRRSQRSLFSEKEFDALYEFVTAFSLMTYDFSHPEMPGPNAPLGWVQECVTALTANETRRPKILMGLNFYGNDYLTKGGGGHILGHELVDRLKKVPDATLTYDEIYGEHYFEYRDDNEVTHIVYYPTLFSIFARLDLAFNLKVGLSIWEIGQGLDYFYDLL